MPADALPPLVLADDECDVRCPWCRGDCCGATVTLEALFVASQAGELEYAHRGADDTADGRALVCECPGCARPFMVALGGKGGTLMRLLPVRTATDAKLLRGGE